MEKIRCIIVDDEKLARAGIMHLLESENDFEVVDQCSNGKQAVESITHFQPDVAFLDIKMPDLSGIEVIGSLKSHIPPIVVFITAYDAYAIEAFEVCAFDYLLKPFDDERFYKVLDRVRCQHALVIKEGTTNISELMEKVDSLMQNHEKSNIYFDRILVKREGGVSFIKTSDILCIEAADYYAKILTEKNEFLVRKSLNNFEKKLNPAEFVRIHRGTIVNVNGLSKIEHYSNDEFVAILTNGKQYRMSKSGKKKFDERFRI